MAYVVADDSLDGSEQVRLAFEDGTAYDGDCYAKRLIRACESVVVPLGLDEQRVWRCLRQKRDVTLPLFGD